MHDTTYVNMAHAREAYQRETMERITKDGVCPFCREYLMEYHTEPILHETPHWVLTKNFAPYKGALHHLLFIAQVHCTAPWELQEEAWADLQKVLAWAREKFALPGGTLLMRWGDSEYTGASVVHLHAQLISGVSRTEGDGPILTSLGYQLKEEVTESPE